MRYKVWYSDELMHYGTPRMKWGRRLYQNQDGTLTPLGKMHYYGAKAAKSAGSAVATATKSAATYAVKKIGSSAQKVVDNMRKTKAEKKEAERASKLADAQAKLNAKEYSKDASKMSADELEKAISRLQMEKQYNQLREELHPDYKKNIQNTIAKTLTRSAADIMSAKINKKVKSIVSDINSDPTDKTNTADLRKKDTKDLTDAEVTQLLKRNEDEYYIAHPDEAVKRNGGQQGKRRGK